MNPDLRLFKEWTGGKWSEAQAIPDAEEPATKKPRVDAPAVSESTVNMGEFHKITNVPFSISKLMSALVPPKVFTSPNVEAFL